MASRQPRHRYKQTGGEAVIAPESLEQSVQREASQHGVVWRCYLHLGRDLLDLPGGSAGPVRA